MKKIAVWLAMIVAGCAGNSVRIDESNTVVTMLVFSGRPDPRWQLTSAEAAVLESKLRDLPSSTAPPFDERLGYRGFLVRSGAQFIEIRSGVVVVDTGTSRRVYRDRHRAEDLLREQAARRGYDNLLRFGQ